MWHTWEPPLNFWFCSKWPFKMRGSDTEGSLLLCIYYYGGVTKKHGVVFLVNLTVETEYGMIWVCLKIGNRHISYLTILNHHFPISSLRKSPFGENLWFSGRSTDQFSHPATQHLRRKRSKWIAGLGATCSLTGHDVHPSRVYAQRSPPGVRPGVSGRQSDSANGIPETLVLRWKKQWLST